MNTGIKNQLKKVQLKWDKLQWYSKTLILVGLIGLLYYVIKEYYLLILIIAVALTIKFLWRAIFCRGKIKNNQGEFNLSIFAESILILWYLALVVTISYVFYSEPMVWYEYVLPFIFMCVNLIKVLEVFANRRDFIIISGPILTWRDGEKIGELKIKSYFFEDQETKAIEFSLYSTEKSEGPFLMVTDIEDKNHSFDLKAMNLGGHHNALKKYMHKHYSTPIE